MVNTTLIITLVSLFSIIFFVVALIILIKLSKLSKNQVPSGATFVITFDKDATNGYVVHLKVKEEILYHGRVLMTLQPLDKKIDADGKSIPVEPMPVSVREKQIHSFGKGQLGRNRDITFIVPDNPESLDTNFIKTPFGNMIYRLCLGVGIEDDISTIREKADRIRKEEIAMAEPEEQRRFQSLVALNEHLMNNKRQEMGGGMGGMNDKP